MTMAELKHSLKREVRPIVILLLMAVTYVLGSADSTCFGFMFFSLKGPYSCTLWERIV